MRRTPAVFAAALSGALFALAPTAGATIHPIVESFDCANAQAFAHHPLGDPADPRGQTPGDLNPAGQETGSTAFTALSHAADSAFSEHKLNGQCGTVGQP
jgi:hypothetical protein